MPAGIATTITGKDPFCWTPYGTHGPYTAMALAPHTAIVFGSVAALAWLFPGG